MSRPSEDEIEYADIPAHDIAEIAVQSCKHQPHCECPWNDDGEIMRCESIYELVCRVLWLNRDVLRRPELPEDGQSGTSGCWGSGKVD